MQNEFQFFITKIIHGVGSSKKVGDIAKKLGARKALVMHGPNVKAAGIVDPCVEALKADGITCIIYDKVEIESPMHSIEEAAALGRAEGADICVAIGGGSCSSPTPAPAAITPRRSARSCTPTRASRSSASRRPPAPALR